MARFHNKSRRRFRHLKRPRTEKFTYHQALYAHLEIMKLLEMRALAGIKKETPSPERAEQLRKSYARLDQIGRRLHGLKRIGVTV